jgi:hypothetical protein
MNTRYLRPDVKKGALLPNSCFNPIQKILHDIHSYLIHPKNTLVRPYLKSCLNQLTTCQTHVSWTHSCHHERIWFRQHWHLYARSWTFLIDPCICIPSSVRTFFSSEFFPRALNFWKLFSPFYDLPFLC